MVNNLMPAMHRPRFDPRVGKIPWRRKWKLTPVFLPEKSHRQRTLEGYSPWGHKQTRLTLSWIIKQKIGIISDPETLR